jgi:serine/threonine protein kinase/Tfp pilus assembly protein PilF
MISCPGAQQLCRLLDEQLDQAVEQLLVAHVEVCEGCQEQLDELVRNRLPNAPWSAARRPDGPVDGPASLRAGRIGHELMDGGLASAERASTFELMADSVPRTELPATSVPTPSDPEHAGGRRASSDIDLPRSADPGTDFDPECHGLGTSHRESLDATDASPPVPNEPIRSRAIDVDATDMAGDRHPEVGDGTEERGSPSAPSPRRSPDWDRTESQLGEQAAYVLDPAPVIPEWCETDRPKIPGYEIFEKLGEGGMGVVYKARQLALNRMVAVKMIIGGCHARADLLARFRVEAEVVARLRHPNIMQIYDIGEVAGLVFVSLELLEGGGLHDRLAGTPHPGRSASELVAKLARAIHAAHQAGIVHRDLKPTNVLFTADGVPKITDFGLAKRLGSDSQQTRTGQIMGSPSYMAPEQASGHTKEVGPAADIFALGAILYEVLTGRPPFKGETPFDTIRQVTDNDPVPPSRLVPRVERDLETICLKCLQREPQHRYESAQDLADDLDRYRDGNPIRARRTPVWERGLKWSRRRPVAAMAAVLCLVASLILTIGAITHQRQERIRIDGRNEWVMSQQNRGMELLVKADAATDREHLGKAQIDLSTFLRDIKDEPRLEGTSVLINEKNRRVADRLRLLSSHEEAENAIRVARDRHQRFLALRQEAHLYGAGFAVLDPADRLQKLRSAAGAALSIYSSDPHAPATAWSVADSLPAGLTDAEKTRVRDGCYDLLLILPQAAEPADGLRILDRAGRLRPEATAAYHLLRADCLERAGDLAARDRETRAAQRCKPVTALDDFLIGRELMFRRQFSDAIRALNTALLRDPDQTSAHLLLAIAHFNLRPKGLSEAEASLIACIRSHPDVVGLYLMRASVYGEKGNLLLGRMAPRPAGDPAASPLAHEAAAAFEAAEADYLRALELNPNVDLRYGLLANRGLLRFRRGRLDEAVADLDAAIHLKPNQYQAHTTMAQVLSGQGRLGEAYAAFTRGIACHPEPIVLAGLYRSRALLHAARKDLAVDQRDAALRDLDQASRLEPDRVHKAGDHVWRARLFFNADQPREALAACDAALTLVPDDADAHRVRISALMVLKRYEEVLASSAAYLAGGKPTAEIFEIRGLALVARREYAAAIADYSRALDLRPEAEAADRSRLLNLRGWVYHFIDAPRLALMDFDESLRLEPAQSDALGGRGLARVRLGQWRSAVADAEAAARLARAVAPTAGEDRQAQAFFNAARIYAQAVEFAAQDVSRQGERSVALYRQYRRRALDLLEQALRQVPDPRRREEILDDPALRPLRLPRSQNPGVGSSGLSRDRSN